MGSTALFTFLALFVPLLTPSHHRRATDASSCHTSHSTSGDGDHQSIDFSAHRRLPPAAGSSCPQGASFNKCQAKYGRVRQIQDQLLSALNLTLQDRPSSEVIAMSGGGMVGNEEGNSNDQQQVVVARRSRAERVFPVTGETRKLIYATTTSVGGNFHGQTPSAPRYFFSLASLRPPHHEITNATLFVHVQSPIRNLLPGQQDGVISDRVQLHMYVYVNGSDVDAEPVISRTIKMDLDGGKWISVDVTQLATLWATRPSKNHGFILKAHSEDGEDLINRTADESNRTLSIFLDVSYRYDGNSMMRYYWSNTVEEKTPLCRDRPTEEDRKCCRYPLIVDFEALGLDFIIAPKRYNAYYCAGDCPSSRRKRKRARSPSSSSTNTSNTISRSCCSPKKHQDMKIIYISNKGSFEERVISNAIIQQCGCSS